MQSAAQALATVVSDPAFNAARLSDQLLIRSLRLRMEEIDLGKAGLSSALGLLSDLAACADLLHGVNARQELLAHDERLLRQTLEGTITGSITGTPQDLVGRLAPLYGRDEELDRCLSRLATEGHSEPVFRVLGRLLAEINR